LIDPHPNNIFAVTPALDDIRIKVYVFRTSIQFSAKFAKIPRKKWVFSAEQHIGGIHWQTPLEM
jgi:hypothetical protein